MQTSFKEMAQRSVNADALFIGNVMEQFGFSEWEANRILSTYRKLKAVKLNWAMGRYDLAHGGFWERDVMQRAIDWPTT